MLHSNATSYEQVAIEYVALSADGDRWLHARYSTAYWPLVGRRASDSHLHSAVFRPLIEFTSRCLSFARLDTAAEVVDAVFGGAMTVGRLRGRLSTIHSFACLFAH